MVSLDRVAYGRPKPIKGWKLVDTATNVGVRFFQITRVRPAVWGYKVARRSR